MSAFARFLGVDCGIGWGEGPPTYLTLPYVSYLHTCHAIHDAWATGMLLGAIEVGIRNQIRSICQMHFTSKQGCLFTCLPVYLFTCLPVYLFTCLPVYCLLFTCLLFIIFFLVNP
ncbi:hypothetical protein BO71DRAFT_220151 [Aspergillus ellipticus CBS 707.79]|uniref:Uncharacterized protein n=1 Tax=Aspergillus ellipticus CBS 707.79 TaxID=1448320 RepID=A0A319DBJ3_9EURO|nr:hypothetical protein BO71DRAFT_220151 [Aspergillus ellipticus CBS 707.79]